jgi:hypothetical protein
MGAEAFEVGWLRYVHHIARTATEPAPLMQVLFLLLPVLVPEWLFVGILSLSTPGRDLTERAAHDPVTGAIFVVGAFAFCMLSLVISASLLMFDQSPVLFARYYFKEKASAEPASGSPPEPKFKDDHLFNIATSLIPAWLFVGVLPFGFLLYAPFSWIGGVAGAMVFFGIDRLFAIFEVFRGFFWILSLLKWFDVPFKWLGWRPRVWIALRVVGLTRILRVLAIAALAYLACTAIFPASVGLFFGAAASAGLIASSWMLVLFLLFYLGAQSGRRDRLSEHFKSIENITPVEYTSLPTVVASVAAWLLPVLVLGVVWPKQPAYVEPVLLERPAARVGLEAALTAFDDKEGRSLLVVAIAAGGGIRAAYWTASVLGAMQDIDGRFSKHLFAVSAVSGGALGAVTVRSILAREPPDCGAPSVQACAASRLSHDYLGPIVAATATGELLNFALWRRTWFTERDVALEDGWQAAAFGRLEKATQSFDSMFLNDKVLSAPPSLLLNGTSKATGERVVTSNLEIADFIPETVGCVVNPAAHLILSRAEAVGNSARFPYVSPSGLIELNWDAEPKPKKSGNGAKCEHRSWEAVVDGGYVDNEGALTAKDLINSLSRLSAFKKFRLVVLRISAEQSPAELTIKPPSDELLDPLTTLDFERSAQSAAVLETLRQTVNRLGGCFLEINTQSELAPLSWVLSKASRTRMDQAIRAPENQKVFATLSREIGEPGTSTQCN